MGNLKSTVSEQQLFDFVAAQVTEPEAVRIIHDKTSGLGKGIAFVTFKDVSSVPLALNLNGTKFKGRDIRITKVAKKKDVSRSFAADHGFRGKWLPPEA